MRSAKSERPEKDAITFHSSPLNNDVGVVLLAIGEYYSNRPREDAYTAAQDFAAQIFAESEYELVYVVAKHTELEHLPYSFFAGFKRPG